MAKDYAARNGRARKKPAGLPGWVWLVAGLSIGLAVAAIVFITRPTSPMPLAPAGKIARQKEAPSIDPVIEVPPLADARFDFYKLLKKEKVVVPPSTIEKPDRPAIGALPEPAAISAPEKKATAPLVQRATGAESGAFWVMAGAFRQSGNADEQRARLAFLGIESRIETSITGDGTQLHRVAVGPESRRENAEKIVAELKANGFGGLVVRR